MKAAYHCAVLWLELPQVHGLKACSPSGGVTLGTVELLGYVASLEEVSHW